MFIIIYYYIAVVVVKLGCIKLMSNLKNIRNVSMSETSVSGTIKTHKNTQNKFVGEDYKIFLWPFMCANGLS